MPYHPKTHDLSDGALQRFVGGEVDVLLCPAVNGFAPERYCGHVEAITRGESAIRIRCSWVAKRTDLSAPDAGAWVGTRFPGGKPYGIDLAVWDVVKADEEGCLVFVHGATGSMATLRPSSSGKTLREEAVGL